MRVRERERVKETEIETMRGTLCYFSYVVLCLFLKYSRVSATETIFMPHTKANTEIFSNFIEYDDIYMVTW